jgi:hypothetical protein
MSFALTLGSWIVPLLVTIAAAAWAVWVTKDNEPGAYGAGAILDLFAWAGALILSLIAWLIWAIVT